MIGPVKIWQGILQQSNYQKGGENDKENEKGGGFFLKGSRDTRAPSPLSLPKNFFLPDSNNTHDRTHDDAGPPGSHQLDDTHSTNRRDKSSQGPKNHDAVKMGNKSCKNSNTGRQEQEEYKIPFWLVGIINNITTKGLAKDLDNICALHDNGILLFVKNTFFDELGLNSGPGASSVVVAKIADQNAEKNNERRTEFLGKDETEGSIFRLGSSSSSSSSRGGG